MDDYNIIIRPLVTEQGMHFAITKSAYCFEVHKKANKAQIKNAVEKIYNVKVLKVRTANRPGKYRRVPGNRRSRHHHRLPEKAYRTTNRRTHPKGRLERKSRAISSVG